MAEAYIFYNPLAGGGKILEDLEALQFVLDETCVLCDMTKPETYGEALFAMDPEDYIVLCGGDGTLNRFVNLTAELERPNDVLYFPSGEHNDFALDFGRRYGDNPFPVKPYIQDLPVITVGDKQMHFLTGVQFLPKNRDNLWLSVHTQTGQRIFQYVHMAAVLFGKYAFGGTQLLPDRSREREDITLLVVSECSRFRAHQILRRIKKGRIPRKSRYITCISAQTLDLRFSSQVQALADGEKLLLQGCRVCRRKENP